MTEEGFQWEEAGTDFKRSGFYADIPSNNKESERRTYKAYRRKCDKNVVWRISWVMWKKGSVDLEVLIPPSCTQSWVAGCSRAAREVIVGTFLPLSLWTRRGIFPQLAVAASEDCFAGALFLLSWEVGRGQKEIVGLEAESICRDFTEILGHHQSLPSRISTHSYPAPLLQYPGPAYTPYSTQGQCWGLEAVRVVVCLHWERRKWKFSCLHWGVDGLGLRLYWEEGGWGLKIFCTSQKLVYCGLRLHFGMWLSQSSLMFLSQCVPYGYPPRLLWCFSWIFQTSSP